MTIQIRKSEDRGHADHGWLDARHTFSFAGYRDPEFMHFGPLRVLNQDRIQPGQGFGAHPHDNMEIVTYVLEGELRHRDDMGIGSVIHPGEVQLMSAGTGVVHSEFNALDDRALHLLQMWVFPSERGTEPRYEQKAFSEADRRGRLRVVVSPDGRDGSLSIGQDACLYAGLLDDGERTTHDLGGERSAWIHVARGSLRLNGLELGPGDGAAVRDEHRLDLAGTDDAELILWDLPA